MSKIELSIVVVSFNTLDLTRSCIKSVKKHTKNIKYEIIAVDNNSTDGSAEAIGKLVDVVIKNKKNMGFAAANNQGIKKARGEYILLLNSDTKLTSNVVKSACGWMESNPKAGIMSCKLKNADGTTQPSGGYFPTILKVFNWMFFVDDIPLVGKFTKPFHPDSMPSKVSRRDWVTGAFFMFRRKLIRDVGLFDEDYFMYTEEVDYCYRANQKKWQTWYVPTFSLVHYGGASSTSEFALLSEYKGLKTFYKKHYNEYQLPLALFLKLGSLIRIPVLGLTKGPSVAKIYAKAFLKS